MLGGKIGSLLIHSGTTNACAQTEGCLKTLSLEISRKCNPRVWDACMVSKLGPPKSSTRVQRVPCDFLPVKIWLSELPLAPHKCLVACKPRVAKKWLPIKFIDNVKRDYRTHSSMPKWGARRWISRVVSELYESFP